MGAMDPGSLLEAASPRGLLVMGLLLIGALFTLIGALGLLRLPDLYLRMSAATKGATLGVCAVMLAVALAYQDLPLAGRALAVIVFLLLTAPVSAHAIGRAAYFSGVPLAEETSIDELEGRYDPLTHRLEGERTEAAAAGDEPAV